MEYIESINKYRDLHSMYRHGLMASSRHNVMEGK